MDARLFECKRDGELVLGMEVPAKCIRITFEGGSYPVKQWDELGGGDFMWGGGMLFSRTYADFRYLDAPAPPAWITDVGRLGEFVEKPIAVEWLETKDRAYGILYHRRTNGMYQLGTSHLVGETDKIRFCEIQLPEEPMEPQLPPHLEDIQVCSIGIPDGIVPEDRLDAVRERARKCYNALAGVEDVEGFVAAAKERG